MKRDPYFDVLKFFAMFLVVFGHTYWAIGCKTGMPYFENFRCGMNMPLFFMISGYFAAHTIESGDWRKLGRHILGYFWPLAIVSFIFAVLAVSFGLEGSDKGLIGYAGRRFLFSSWFLWCLAGCFVLTFVCSRPKHIVFRRGAFLSLIILLPCLNGVWQMHGVRAMMPHFLFGAFVLRRWNVWRNWRIGLPCLVAFLAGVFLQGDILMNGLSFYKGETSWRAFFADGYMFPLYLTRLINGVVGSVGAMWLLYVLVEKLSLMRALAPLGTTSLGVYILHQWLLARIPSGWFSGIDGVILLSFLLFGICHLFVAATRKIEFFRRFLWGDFGEAERK